MHYAVYLVALATKLALAIPQVDSSQLSGLPPCARDAAAAALGSSGCSLSDTTCICNSKAFQEAITTTILQSCSTGDVQAAVAFGQTICGKGLGADAPTASDSYNAPTDGAVVGGVSTTTVPTTETSTTSVPVDTASATITASVSTVPTTWTTMWNTSCTTTTGMAPTAPGSAPATYTGAAVEVKFGQGVLAAVVGVAGAVALF
ncbi:uncharacterized protein PV06_02370 [Exophiala oligosperma]|uniref:CFEM domain-containing protein n=2 Tax=Chaetothyriales TaxID=34395 RepID=A0A0D2EFK9_9EURO|nr:uncharacterized protein PV06_02370 [Exophiala oligosperma]KAJ9640630.1 hypothetical protein H2204_003259 [Knufia peltigerae]KIW46724.1 hypothetical protein PV06_02370 [Exophiala oligosperma]